MRSIAIVGLLLSAHFATAADSPGEWTYPITRNGKPAVGVKAGLTTFDYTDVNKPRMSDPVFATSNEKGDVRFSKPADISRSAHVLARDQDGHGGYGLLSGTNRYPPTLELHDNSELTGRVLDETGKPISGLKLKPVALGPESVAVSGGRMVAYARTPEWFWTDFSVKLATDGSFTLAGVPVGHSVSMRFEAPGFGSGQFWVLPGNPTTETLRKSGAIRVKFSSTAGAKVDGIRVHVSRTASIDQLEATDDAESKEGANVVLTGLPPGEYSLSFPYRDTKFFPKAVARVMVKPGEIAEVTTSLEPTAKITARFVDAMTGKGVLGARASVSVTRHPADTVSVPVTTADATGKIEIHVPAGMVQLTPRPINGYVVRKFSKNPFNPFSTEPVPVAAGEAHDFGNFALLKTVELIGVVVDEADKPVAGADVFVGYNGSSSATVPKKTDEEGRFTVRDLNPEGGVVGLTARKGNTITAAPVGVDPGKPEGEVRLCISPKFGAHVRVRAVDRTGKPIAGVSIELMHSVRFLSQSGGLVGFGRGGKVGRTHADGRFTSAALQPGDQYTVTLSAPGYRLAMTTTWTAKLGESHDFGEFTLVRANLAIHGTVTDLAGKPVAGATVFDNADGPKPTETKTDENGRFTLGGLYEGMAFVSIRAKDFRLASSPGEPGGPAIAVTLRRQTDPPSTPPTIPETQQATTAKLARHVLATMWKNRVVANDDGKSTLRAMARLDPATAQKWRDEEKTRTGGKSDLAFEIESAMRDCNLLKIAKEDADEAVALLKTVSKIEGFRAVCLLAGQLLKDSPDKSLRVAEEAVIRARGLDESERVWALAQAGELVFRAGKKDAGRKLIEEAARLTTSLGYADLDSYRRGMVACRVALYDPAACRKMIDPMKGASDFNRWLSQSCARVAEHDLVMAKRWFADFRPDNSFAKHNARQFMAYRIVNSKPNDAIAIARGIEDKTIHACTLAGLALRLKDRTHAAKLLEETMDGIVADPNGYYNGGGAVTAAVVLFRAKQFGHSDLAGLRDKVLATRMATHPRYGQDADYQFALALALTDPTTARFLLARMLPASERIKLDGLQKREALVALLLCDSETIPTVADTILAHAIEAKKGYDYTGLDTLATLLSRPDRLAESALSAGRFLVDFGEE